jgi:hypothetical protein
MASASTPSKFFILVRVRRNVIRFARHSNPQIEYLGVTYLADPICDDVHTTLPLELFTVTFEGSYYSTNPGKIPSLSASSTS